MSFTADEAWEFVAAKAEESVHAATWTGDGIVRTDLESQLWKQLFEVREAVLPALEAARREKIIGKGLDAKVELTDASISGTESNSELLRELLNVSQLELSSKSLGEELEVMKVAVSRADGQKCARCWHWETDVGSHKEHPTLCKRCVAAVNEYLAAK